MLEPKTFLRGPRLRPKGPKELLLAKVKNASGGVGMILILFLFPPTSAENPHRDLLNKEYTESICVLNSHITGLHFQKAYTHSGTMNNEFI